MTLSDEQRAPARRTHMLTELRFHVGLETAETGTLTGEGEVTPFMHAPGTPHLRTSILIIWADMLGGWLSLAAMRPRVPVTLELDINLYRPAPGAGRVTAIGKTVKAGRSVRVVECEFRDADGTVFAFSTGLFMANSDTSLTVPSGAMSTRLITDAPPLSVPLSERADLTRVSPGVVELPLTDESLNSSKTLNGGLIGVAAEEAVLSLAPPGATVSSLALRYLSPVRTGPAVATASGENGLYRAEIRDQGNAGRLAVLAAVRTF